MQRILVATFAADPSVTGQAGLIAADALFVLNLPVVGGRAALSEAIR